MDEMHTLGYIVKMGSSEMEVEEKKNKDNYNYN